MRLVDEKIATYQEICQYWDINEVMEWHEILDMRADAEWRMHKDHEREMKRARNR